MNKGIWAGLVAIAFVAGSITTGTMAYAASNAQGQPFQQLQQQINELRDQIGIGPDNFTVDSFFDVFYDIELSSSSCREGDIPKVNEDLQTTECVPETTLTPDSFFDVFYDIETQVDENTRDIDTEIVALQLHSADPNAHHAPDNLGNHMAEQSLDMKRFDIENAENIRANNLLHSGRNIVAVDSITAGNEITAANSIFSPGFVKGGHLCIGSDCRSSWPVGGPIEGSDIVDGTITGADIAPNTITGLHIQDGSVGSADIMDGSITSVDIADNTITSSDLAANSVGTSELATDAVTRAKLAQDGCANNQILSWNGAEWICTDIEAPFSSLFFDGGTGLFRDDTRDVTCPRGQVLTGLQVIVAGTDSVVSIGFNPRCSPITP